MQEGQPGWAEYQVIKAERKAAKEGATTNQQASQQAQRDALFERQKAERSELFTRSWQGQGTLRNAMLSIVATRHAAEKLELRERQKAEREAMREQHRPLPQYKQWKERPQIVSEVEQIEVKPVQQQQLAALLRSLRQSPDLSGYFTYRSGDVALFRDEGKIIAVLDQSPSSIAAALAVAQQRHGQTLTLTGDEAFKRRAVAAAVEFGLTIKFADPALEAMRLQTIEDKRQSEREARQAQQAVEKEKAAAQEKAAALSEPALPPPTHPAPGAQAPFLPPALPMPLPLLLSAEWLAAQAKPIEPARLAGNGKLEFVVVHVSDRVVLDHGRAVAEYPLPLPDAAFHVGQRVVINRDGSLSLAPDRFDLDKDKGQGR